MNNQKSDILLYAAEVARGRVVDPVRYNVRCPRCCEIIHGNSENTVRLDIALHLTKHNEYSETETKCRMMLWADEIIHQFYFEASYPVMGNSLSTYYDEVWVVGFVREPSVIHTFEESAQDQDRIALLRKMFEDIDQYETAMSVETDIVPLKYENLSNVPRTSAVRMRVSTRDKKPLSIKEVTTVLETKASLLARVSCHD